MKLLFIPMFFLLLFSCQKSNTGVFVKETTSVFDSDLITISGSEISDFYNSDNVVTDLKVTVYWMSQDTWVLADDTHTVKAYITIDSINGNVSIEMYGAPIDPSAKVKVLIYRC